VTGTGGGQRWVTHLERTTDGFATSPTDLVLANVPANAPAPTFLPYIGDYSHLMSVGKDFYGIFSANNTPDPTNFPSGVTYQRNANLSATTPMLLDLDNTTPVPVSIDHDYTGGTGKLLGSRRSDNQQHRDGQFDYA